MRTATIEEISALELLAVELERICALRTAAELERDRALRAVELELSHAVPFSRDTRPLVHQEPSGQPESPSQWTAQSP